MQLTDPPPIGAESISAAKLARRWGTSSAALANMRHRGEGPPWFRVSERMVVYPVDQLLEYEREMQKRKPASPRVAR